MHQTFFNLNLETQTLPTRKIGVGLLTLPLVATAFAATPIPDISLASEGQHVFINIPQQRLFIYTDGQLAKAHPVAVGKSMTQTTLEEYKIGVKAFNPTWHTPQSIQKERSDGVKSVPPGPKGPLGPVFVRLGDSKPGLDIHGTNTPASIPGIRSHGCVRMKSPDALEFATIITTDSPTYVIYQMASLNEDANKNPWLAAYRDPYNKKNLNTDAPRKSIAAWAKANGKNINNKRIDAILKARTGTANCLTCAKGAKLTMPLKSLAWTNGSSVYSKPKFMPEPVPAQNDVLPAGSEIEVDADDFVPDKATSATFIPSNTSASDTQNHSRKPAGSTYTTTPIPGNNEPTEALF